MGEADSRVSTNQRIFTAKPRRPLQTYRFHQRVQRQRITVFRDKVKITIKMISKNITRLLLRRSKNLREKARGFNRLVLLLVSISLESLRTEKHTMPHSSFLIMSLKLKPVGIMVATLQQREEVGASKLTLQS
jgi:hypothetical protein